MDRRRGRKVLRIAGLVAAVILAGTSLAGCERGEVAGVTGVSDVWATLHGTVHSNDPTPRYWFEYDPSPTLADGQLTFASSTPQNQWACCGPMLSASTRIEGLTPATTYHYRFCIRTESGGGLCGTPSSFTTRPDDRDVVRGSVAIPIFPELGYYQGVSLHVRAEPDGSSPLGWVSRAPGSSYFRLPDQGEATCLRVVGNRAAAGFVATTDEGTEVPQVVFVEDNGPSGDRFGHLLVDHEPLECPDPATSAVPWNVAAEGDITITDHPG